MAESAKSSKGVSMYLSKGGTEPATVKPTAISKANPAVVTAPAPAAPAPAYAPGQVIYMHDTGFTELDEKFFTIDAVVDATGFSLLGSDTTDSKGVLGANAEFEVYDNANLIKMCLNNFAFNLEAPGTIPAGTYCNPTATLPSTATAVGGATLGGWIDKDDLAYRELLLAEEDGETRVFVIVLPQNQGEIISSMTISGITWDIPLEGGMAFTATGVLQSKPRHIFAAVEDPEALAAPVSEPSTGPAPIPPAPPASPPETV